MNNILRGIFRISLIFFSTQAFSQGLFSSFEKLLKAQKIKYESLTNSLLNQDFSLTEVDDINTIRIDPSYLNILIQNTPTRYILLGTNDRCSLYDLMQTDLLKSPNGLVKNVVINYLNKEKVKQKRVLEKTRFLNLIAHVQCPKVKEFKEYFAPNNARATLKDIKLTPPTSKKECYDLFDEFKKDLKSPYLCNIVEHLRSTKSTTKRLNSLSKTNYKERAIYQKKLLKAASYNKILSKKAKSLLNGVCLNLSTPENYCYQYFTQSFWSQNFLEDPKSPLLRSYCKGMNKKKCISTLNSDPSFCHYAGKEYPGLFPKENCAELSRALLKSQSNKLANDCPARTGNDAVTTFARVLNKHKNLTDSKLNCEANSTLAFAEFSKTANDFQTWQINLCYLNKLDGNKKVCYPTVLSEIENNQLSLSHNVQTIAKRTKGYTEKNCRMVELKDYKPSLLEYKTGCHIIYDKNKCLGTHCNFKVIIDERDFSSTLLQESNLKFSLFPYDYINENKSVTKHFVKMNKLNLKTIKNMTSYLSIKKNHPKASFIGMGCREDLLPSFFQKLSLNDCTPLPFTIDGFFEDNGSYSLVTRTALDQIHAPRIIPWPYIFASIKSYQELHPIKNWGFYAIY